MNTTQHKWQPEIGWSNALQQEAEAQLCLVFGSRLTLESDQDAYQQLRALYPTAAIVTASTAGNIIDEELIDDAIIATAIHFKHTNIRTHLFALTAAPASELGERIARHFDASDLSAVLLFSATGINAGQLLAGINGVFGGRVPVSGGVAGDDYRFERTLIGLNDNLNEGQIVVIGLYGAAIKVAHGSKGGWDTFGPIRKVTRCEGNILYEIDGKPALDLYKEYLGEKAEDLPSSGLLFPFTIIDAQTKEPVVRGIQNIDEANNAIILYGDMEEGMTIQLMRANFDNLISGAGDSAKETFLQQNGKPDLALLISCVARRLVLNQLTEEELTETRKVLGPNTTMCGFYSYSEISPLVGDNACHLHNQTMTITTLTEVV